MTGEKDRVIPPPQGTIEEQLIRAARDLMSMVYESGEDFVVFMDRRRLKTKIAREPNEMYGVSWEHDDGSWLPFERKFDNPREAAFHGYQGPH
jgi:hypothetical protein